MSLPEFDDDSIGRPSTLSRPSKSLVGKIGYTSQPVGVVDGCTQLPLAHAMLAIPWKATPPDAYMNDDDPTCAGRTRVRRIHTGA